MRRPSPAAGSPAPVESRVRGPLPLTEPGARAVEPLPGIDGPSALAVGGRPDTHRGRGRLLRLQRTIGNAAVDRLLHPNSPSSSIRRQEEETEFASEDEDLETSEEEAAPAVEEPGEAPEEEVSEEEATPAAEEAVDGLSSESSPEDDATEESAPESDGGDADATEPEAPEEPDVPLNMIRQDVTRFPQIGLGVAEASGGGVMVAEVAEDQAAGTMLHERDLLLTVDMLEMTGIGLLSEVLAAKQPGDVVVLGFRSADAEIPIGGESAAAGEAGVQRTPDIQRQPMPTPSGIAVLPVQGGQQPPQPNVQVNVRDWPTKLTTVTRGPGKQIQKEVDSLNLKNTSLGVDAPLTAEQQAIVAKIKQNRDTIPLSAKLTEREQMGRGQKDSKGGFIYGGGGTKLQAQNPETDQKRKQVWDAVAAEIGGGEGHISAINTYDDAWVSLGGGFAHGQLSAMMERFLKDDPQAKEMFLDVGVSFEGGRLLIVNTDNGGIEADALGSTNMTFNARKIMAMSKPILSLHISIAEDATHGQKLVNAQVGETQGFKFPASVAQTWTDMMAVRLVAHLIHSRGSVGWGGYAGTGGNVKSILKIFAEQASGAKRDPDKGDALVTTGTMTTVVFAMAQGKAKSVLDAPASAALTTPIAPGSLQNVLLFTDPADATKFFRVSF